MVEQQELAAEEQARLEARLAERNRALKKIDMEYARRTMPGASSDEVRLMAMHKARYEVTAMPARLRHASREWLELRGYRRLYDLPWPADRSLPE